MDTSTCFYKMDTCNIFIISVIIVCATSLQSTWQLLVATVHNNTF